MSGLYIWRITRQNCNAVSFVKVIIMFELFSHEHLNVLYTIGSWDNPLLIFTSLNATDVPDPQMQKRLTNNFQM